MKVKALRAFVGTAEGIKHRIEAGQVFDLPKGADWLKAGLVELVVAEKPAKKEKKGN